jgi:hypothetical protein
MDSQDPSCKICWTNFITRSSMVTITSLDINSFTSITSSRTGSRCACSVAEEDEDCGFCSLGNKESLNFFISLRSAIPSAVGSSIDFNFRFRSAILPKFQFLDFQRAGYDTALPHHHRYEDTSLIP